MNINLYLEFYKLLIILYKLKLYLVRFLINFHITKSHIHIFYIYKKYILIVFNYLHFFKQQKRPMYKH